MLRATHNWWAGSPSHVNHARKVRADGRRPTHKSAGNWYTVVHDPTGDYRRGAQFSAVDVEYMLREGGIGDGAELVRSGVRWIVQDGRLVMTGGVG